MVDADVGFDESKSKHQLKKMKKKQTFMVMVKYYRKKPVCAASVCILSLWLPMVLYAAFKTMSLEKTINEAKNTEFPLYRGGIKTESDLDKMLADLDIPPDNSHEKSIEINEKRKILLRGWMNQKRSNQTKEKRLIYKDRNISILAAIFAKKLKEKYKKLSLLKTVSFESSSPSFTTIQSTIRIGSSKKSSKSIISSAPQTKTGFSLSNSEYKNLLRKTSNKRVQNKHEANIPENLQKEIGPISNYTDNAKIREEGERKRGFMFQLPFWVVNRLVRENGGKMRIEQNDNTSRDNVKNEIGPISEYDEGDDNDETDDNEIKINRSLLNWMKYFGERMNDDSS